MPLYRVRTMDPNEWEIDTRQHEASKLKNPLTFHVVSYYDRELKHEPR